MMSTTLDRPAGTHGGGWRPVLRVAEVRLRGPAGPLPARVFWPVPRDTRTPALLVFFPADGSVPAGLDRADPLCRDLCSGVPGAVVLAVSHRSVDDAIAVTGWAAQHAAELGADPGRIFITGAGHACDLVAAVLRDAREQGWPVLTRLVLV